MKKTKLLALLLVCAMCASGCGNGDSSSEEDASSAKESVSSTVTSVTGDASAVSNTETSAAASAPDSESDSTSESDPSSDSASDSVPDSAADSSPDQKPEVGGRTTKLKELALNTFGAVDLTGKKDIKAENEKMINKAGKVCYTASMKTIDHFDPFDDLTVSIGAIAKLCENSEIFMLTRVYEIKNAGSMFDNDGFVTAIAFPCKDEATAKNLFKLMFSDDIKKQMANMTEKYGGFNGESTDTYGIYNMNNEEFVGYYLVGDTVYCVGCTDLRGDFEDELADGSKYKSEIDYPAELEKLCNAVGVKSPTKVSGGSVKQPDGGKNTTPNEMQKLFIDKYGAEIVGISFDMEKDAAEKMKKGAEPSYLVEGSSDDIGMIFTRLIGEEALDAAPEKMSVFVKPYYDGKDNEEPSSMIYCFWFDCKDESQAIKVKNLCFKQLSEQLEEAGNNSSAPKVKKDTDYLLTKDDDGIGGWYRVGNRFIMVFSFEIGSAKKAEDSEIEKLCGLLNVKSPTKI